MSHCRTCGLGAGHPGITVDDEGICNLCRLEVIDDLLANYRYTTEVFEEFQRAGRADADHDCLFMYSGGKDSTYLLDKFVNEEGKRVLAYTFDVPFESRHAARNIERARELIPATFVMDSDDDGITRMMREAFNRPPDAPGRYLDEKLPCMSCRSFFVIRAILRAVRDRIPYIVLCADPQQILTMESNVRDIARSFYTRFGAALADELFRGELEHVLFAPDDELPKIVFPFIAMRHEYDPERIVEELRAKGLYTSSPMETHCTLFPLLNYYSFKNWDCMFYKLNASSHVRRVRRGGAAGHGRSTFSISFPDDLDVLAVEDRLRRVTLEIANGGGDPVAQEGELVGVFRELGASDDAARFVARSFLDMPTLARDMGLHL